MIASPAAAKAEAHRLFVAILPPGEVATIIGEQRRAFGVTRSPVSDARLHITIGISDDHDALPGELIDAATRAGEALVAAPFRVVLDQAVGSAGSVALRPSEPLPRLITLQEQLAARMAEVGFAQRPGWRFNPHVTLGYRKGEPFTEQILPISWIVTDFVLIHSHVGRTRHDILARWPLR